ncbi:MAG: hypothetical protein WAV90_13835 [Gordonia amarae]
MPDPATDGAHCECDQLCCTWCAVHGDTGVDMDARCAEDEARFHVGLRVSVVREVSHG